MTQSELESLRRQVRQQELASLVVVIDGAKAAAEGAQKTGSTALEEFRNLEKKYILLKHDYDKSVVTIERLVVRVEAISTARWGTIGTVTAALLATLANIIVAVIKGN